MTVAQWLESTFDPDKFTPGKAVRYAQGEYSLDRDTTSILRDLATEKIQRDGHLLTTTDVETLIQRARVHNRHSQRLATETTERPRPPTEDVTTFYPKVTELYDRFDNQLKLVKSTLIPSWSLDESRSIRNLKLKTAQKNILTILEDATKLARAKAYISPEFDRIMKLEIVRWTELARLIQARVTGQTTGLALRDAVTALEKSFLETRKELDEKFRQKSS